MQRSVMEYLNRELALLMAYNPPTRFLDPKASHACPQLTPPLTFYDKHLDASLSYKKVVVIPLAEYLSQAMDNTARSFRERKSPLPPPHPDDFFLSQECRAFDEPRTSITDAESLANIYQHTTGFHCSVVASTLLFHFRAPGWFTTLNWKQVGAPGMEKFYAFTERYALQLRRWDRVPREIQESMDEETRTTWQRVQRRRDVLAFWEIFAISTEAENLLKEMDEAASLECFDYGTCRTQGYSTQPVLALATLDASMTGWGVTMSTMTASSTPHETSTNQQQSATDPDCAPDTTESRRRSARLLESVPIRKEYMKKIKTATSKKKAVELPSVSGCAWPSVTMPPRVPVSTETSSMKSQFLQRAWARSVEYDTTYIIFHCGNYERIAFRHRASQTLFLSTLIDVPQCEHPGYGKIHIGLFLSILQDIVDRMEHECKEETPQSSRNRRRSAIALPSNKCYRTRAMTLKEQKEADERHTNHVIVKKELASRSLALLELRYGIYNSPSPASFLRPHHVHKVHYSPEEYFSLVLTSRIAAGATGVAHEARLELLSSDAQVRHLDVVVKLAFEPEPIKRLRHESFVYEHLASHGVVEGIPTTYGLFEDAETDAIALVMSHAGTALATLHSNDRDFGLGLSESTRAAYFRVLRRIHEAGVRHHDLRPENLTLTDDNQVAIIDFDMAELNPSEGAKRREMSHMTELLTGLYTPPNLFPSAATTPEKQPTVRIYTVIDAVDDDDSDEDE